MNERPFEKIRLWLHYLWLCKKIISTNAWTIHNQGLRLALGGFITFLVASLYLEAGEPSLYSRREKLSLQYAISLAANQSNHAHEGSFSPKTLTYMRRNPIILNHLISDFTTFRVCQYQTSKYWKKFTPNIPAWCLKQPDILFCLSLWQNFWNKSRHSIKTI